MDETREKLGLQAGREKGRSCEGANPLAAETGAGGGGRVGGGTGGLTISVLRVDAVVRPGHQRGSGRWRA